MSTDNMEPQSEVITLTESSSAPSTPTLSPEEAELRAAQERLDQARKKKAEADEQKLIAARTALLQRQAAEEKVLAEQRETQRLIQEKWATIEAEKKAAREAEQRKAEQEKRELENLLAAQELAKQKREAHEKELLRISEEAFRLEQEAKQAEADALRVATPAEEPAPSTLATTPLGFLFGSGSQQQ